MNENREEFSTDCARTDHQTINSSQAEKVQIPTDAAPGSAAASDAPPVLHTFRRNFSLFGAASAIYALFYTFCLYQNVSGITYPFFVAGTLYYFCFCMKRCKVPFKKDMMFYAVSLLLLGLSVCLTADPKILWMTKTGIFLLFISFLLHNFYQDEKWGLFKYLGAILSSICEIVACVHYPIKDSFDWLTKKEEDESRRKWRYVILGLFAGIPLFLLILVLLLFADVMFEHYVEKLLGNFNFGTFFGIISMTAIAFLGMYSLFASLLRHRIKEDCHTLQKAEPLLAITITLPIAIIYLFFCGIQIVYLFGRFAQLPAQYTWSSYARQGFFQLLAVCLINLVLVCFCLYRFRRSRLLSCILACICLMTYIMIASSAYRMILYVQAYYLTFLRFFVLWALAVIALIITGVLTYKEQGYWDVLYLSNLSADAAPVLLEEEYYKALQSSYAADSMRRYYNGFARDAAEMSLREFNVSLWMARER